MPTVGSLFSGIGGLDLGLERAGWEVKWQIENNEYCNRVLEKHWPNVRRYGDITTVDPGEFERVDLICGGFPCQDLSVAGKRAGLAGERSILFFEYLRMVSAIRPAWALVENVPGLRSSNEGKDMAIVIEALSELGHGVAWRSLDSEYFGVAQRRERVFFVGCLGGPCPPEILFEPESVYRHLASSEGAGQDVAGTLASGAHPSGFNGRDAERGNIVIQDDSKATYGDKAYLGVGGSGHPSVAVRLAQTSSNGWGISEDITHTLDETGGDAVLQPEYYSHDYAHDRVYSAKGKAPAVVETNGSGSRNIRINSLVRRLTPLECERLQGFPDNWTGIGSDAQRYRALGNAVTVPVAEWIGRRMLERL